MHKRRCLKGCSLRLPGHFHHSQTAQFVINQRQQFRRRVVIAVLDRRKNLRDVIHRTPIECDQPEDFSNGRFCTAVGRL